MHQTDQLATKATAVAPRPRAVATTIAPAFAALGLADDAQGL